MAHVVVQHERSQPNPAGGLRHRRERDEGRRAGTDMVAEQHDIEADRLGSARRGHRIGGLLAAELQPESQVSRHSRR